MRLNCVIDGRQYKSKPRGAEFGAISRRLETTPGQSLSIEEFVQHLKQGRSYLSGHLTSKSMGRVKENINNINFFSLDVDNHYLENKQDVYTKYTREDAIQHIDDLLGITPIIIYTTFSAQNSNGSERFRLIYALDHCAGNGDISWVLNYISENSRDIFDKACKDASRIFLATNQSITVCDKYTLLSSQKIEDIKSLEIKRAEKETRLRKEKRKAAAANNLGGFSDDIINELKTIDISDYLIAQGYVDIEKYKGGYKMPCPIHHGKNKNFVINQVDGAWLYNCFSKCGGVGGSIIDLHAELNNVAIGTAIHELTLMYNMQPKKPIFDMADTYQIEKYIGNDKNATSAILGAVERNERMLLTGSMGCGKTHFMTNHLYDYAKSIDKKLIIVIPGVKQLENLSFNKDINVVYQGNPIYNGSDRVATTPESLPKIVCELEPESYILVVDESHERYTSLYRAGYKYKNIEYAEVGAYRSVHLTATPRLLVNDKFDKVISIETETTISNNIEIYRVKDRIGDNMLSVVKSLIDKNMKPILFNNNKENNELFAKTVELREKVTIATYEEGQIDLFCPNKKNVKDINKTIIATETIRSGKESANIAKGQVKADLTCTTSAVLAGIDLYTDDSAVLVVNTKGLAFDNLIQLVGRFREGIDIILMVEDSRYKRDFFDLEARTGYMLRSSNELAVIANNNKLIHDLMDDGVKKSAKLQRKNNIWEINETEVIAEVYTKWSRAVFDNIDRLEELLEEQRAFKVNSITVSDYYDENERTITELRKLSREETKMIIQNATEKMLELSDAELGRVLCKDYFCMDQDQVDIYDEYFKVAAKHTEKIRLATNKLFTDEMGERDIVAAFRHFYNNSWASIEREIQAQQAREVNRFIKKHGTDFYLTKEAGKFKAAIDIVQAKIRYELRDIEKKQGRLTKKRGAKLIATLVNEGYIYNKHTKILSGKPTEEEKEKALQSLGDIVKAKVENIYNFDSSGKLQSPKI